MYRCRFFLFVVCVFCVVYVPIFYYTYEFLVAGYRTEVSAVPYGVDSAVHQIFIPFGPMPSAWAECSRTWDSFVVTRWDEKMCQSVISKAMPNRRELLDYKGVMFTDVCRVAIMYVHGGVYADMDICAKPGFRFRKCKACFFETSVGVSNDMMIAEKEHPVFLSILQQYADHAWVNSWWYLPYIQEMYSTGPVRFTIATHGYPNTSVIRYENIIHIHGNSWHSWDAILFMHPWLLCVLCCAVGVFKCRGVKRDILLGKDI